MYIHITESQSENGYIYAISAAAFIILPFIIFIIYDCKATQRQKEIIKSSTQSAAIVTSLFPGTIADKLYPTQSNSNNQQKKKKSLDSLNNNYITADTTEDMIGNNNDGNGSGISAHNDEPIADFYPDTTVLFSGKVELI